MTPRPGFEEWLLDVAEAVAQRSRDPSTKVGAVVVRPDKSFAAVGYNGFPREMPDDPDLYEDRQKKYPRIVHAEMNAILSSMDPVRGYTLAVTHPPCEVCAKLIAAAGIRHVIFRSHSGVSDRFDTRMAIQIFAECGIAVTEIFDENGHL